MYQFCTSLNVSQVKNLSVLINVILAIAVAVLYYLQFQGPAEEEVVEEPEVVEEEKRQATIFYVNTDTVWVNYEYVQQIDEMLKDKKSKYERQFENKVRAFEKELEDFQRTAASMSEMSLKIKQNEFIKKEQELALYKEKLEISLIEEEQEYKKEVRTKIIDEIRAVNEGVDFDYVLGYAEAGGILLASDSLDITDKVLHNLNEAHRASQKLEVE